MASFKETIKSIPTFGAGKLLSLRQETLMKPAKCVSYVPVFAAKLYFRKKAPAELCNTCPARENCPLSRST